MAEPLSIGGHSIPRGSNVTVDIGMSRLYTHTPIDIPVHVLRGRRDGPRLFVSAAIHGDELNGVEVVRRLVRMPALKRLRGTLIAVPVVNVHGFIAHSRYLPDRRDLNRSFPGSSRGSLSARLAYRFMNEVVANATHGIDLHTGAIHRGNLPQIRARLQDPETEALARAFQVPVILDAELRDGSLREAAAERGIPTLVYEAGEALRFDEFAIRAAVRGILSVMRHLEMLPRRKRRKGLPAPYVATASRWIRAPASGILHTRVQLGKRVNKGDVLAGVEDPFGSNQEPVTAPTDGVIIGKLNMPLVNEGDAVFHLARFEEPGAAARSVEAFHSNSTETEEEPAPF